MRKLTSATAVAALLAASPALREGSRFVRLSGAVDPRRAEIPHCTRQARHDRDRRARQAVVARFNLGSPEAILKVFVQQSGCFSLVNRGRAMQSRAMERAMADQGELQRGSNLGKGQVKAADYFLEPNIVGANANSGGGGGGAVARRAWRPVRRPGAARRIAGGSTSRRRKPMSRCRWSMRRTTEEEALVEGYARKSDVSFGGGGAAVGRRFARPAAAAIRTPRSARSSCSPISTPISSWSRSSAACPTMRQPRRPSPANKRRRKPETSAVPVRRGGALFLRGSCVIIRAKEIPMRRSVLSALCLILATPAAAQTLLIGNKAEDTVSFIDLATGKERARVETAHMPHEIAISPNGKQAAVVAYGGSTLDIFDVASASRVKRIDLSPNVAPHGIAWLRDGRLVVTTEKSKSLTLVDPASGAVSAA
jgi:hypothetical protein